MIIEQIPQWRWELQTVEDEYVLHILEVEALQIPPTSPTAPPAGIAWVPRRITLPLTKADAARLGRALQGEKVGPEIQTALRVPHRPGSNGG